MRPTILKVALAAGAAFNVLAMAAHAQAQAASGVADVEAVVVTGSRIITNGNNAPTPLSVLTPAQALVSKPTSLYENLADMPVFSGSRGMSNGPAISSGAQGATGSGAVSSLNLRNMGAARTLTLFDGHRVPPSTPDGIVDVSALPQMLIQRIDVVTGGASAVYGSDAVTGVVNYITDSKFNGLKVNLQRGVSHQGDAGANEVGVAAGKQFLGGRAHAEFSFQHQEDAGLYDVQRDWTKPRWTVQGNGTTIPWHLVSNLTNATASYGGAIACKANGQLIASLCPTEPLVGMTFSQNGVLTPFDPGLRGAANGLASTAVQIGGDGVYFNNVALRSKTRRDQLFGRFDFDVSDKVHAYISGSGSRNTASGNIGVQRSFPPGWKMGACNLYLPAAIRTQLNCVASAAGTPAEATFSLEKAFDPYVNYGVGQNSRSESESYFIMANLAGSFGETFHWEGTYTHSLAKVSVDFQNQNRQHVYAALDPALDPSGKVVCRTDLTNPGLYPGCVPINPFGPTAPSKEAVNYLFDMINSASRNKLDSVSGSLTGEPLNSWAGPIGMAVSGEIRKLTMDLTTNSRTDDFLNCTGLRFGNCTANTPVHANGWLPVKGVNQTVREGAFEVNVPLAKDMGLLKDVNFNGAVRYTSYENDSNGTAAASPKFNATTWKAGLVWQVADQLTLRLARSKDIRAPSLYELYQPFTTGNAAFATDYLLNPGGVQISQFPKSGGNTNLTPEVANTTTLGLVFRPTPSFSLSLDAYSIKLTNVLYSLNGASQPNQVACYNSGGSSPLCQLQDRPFPITNTSAANAATSFYTRQINIARQQTKGVDAEANYRSELFGRPASARLLATYQPHIYYYLPDFANVQDTAGVAYPQIGGLPAPVWKASLFLNFSPFERWTVDISERFRSRLRWTSDPVQTELGGVDSISYTNVTVTHALDIGGAQANVFLNVQNLFDTEPPPAAPLAGTFPGSFPGTYAVGDDVVGRYYTLGIRFRF